MQIGYDYVLHIQAAIDATSLPADLAVTDV